MAAPAVGPKRAISGFVFEVFETNTAEMTIWQRVKDVAKKVFAAAVLLGFLRYSPLFFITGFTWALIDPKGAERGIDAISRIWAHHTKKVLAITGFAAFLALQYTAPIAVMAVGAACARHLHNTADPELFPRAALAPAPVPAA